jgi:hypothetical protein
MDAQKAQIRTASVAIGLEPKSARNGREDVDKSFGPASVVLRGYGRKVGAGSGLTCYPA